MKNIASISKTALLSLFLFILIFFFQSQSVAQSQTKYGIKAGLNFSNFYGTDAEGDENTPPFESKSGMTIGVFMDSPFNNIFSLQPEFLFSMKGAKNSEEEQGASVTATFNLSYLELVVPIKAALPITQSMGLYLLGGAELGLNIKSNFEVTVNGTTVKEMGFGDHTNTFEFGLLFGMGFSLSMGEGSMLLEGRYGLGLTTPYKEENGESLDMKNKVFSLMLGYTF